MTIPTCGGFLSLLGPMSQVEQIKGGLSFLEAHPGTIVGILIKITSASTLKCDNRLWGCTMISF